MMTLRASFLQFMLGCVTCLPTCLGGPDAAQDPDLAQLESRAKYLSTVLVDYSFSRDLTPPEQIGNLGLIAPHNGGKLTAISGHENGVGVFARLPEDFILYSSILDDKTAKQEAARGVPVHRIEVIAFKPDGIRRYLGISGQSPQLQVLSKGRLDLPPTSIVDVGLGLRRFGAATLLSAEDFQAAERSANPDTLTLTINNPGGTSDILTFDKRHGFALAKYVLSKGAKTYVEIACDDFAKEQDIWVPTKISETGYWYTGETERRAVHSEVVTISRVDFSQARNTKALYEVQAPSGATLMKDKPADAKLDILRAD